MGFSIVDGERTVPILVEREAFSGIRRIANVLADDICSVCRKKPEVIDESGLESYTGKELISVYYGEDVSSEQVDSLTAKIEETYPDLDLEVHSGGQPIYYYIVSVE